MRIKETFKNIFNRGSETPTPLKSAELSAIEPELEEITKKLEHERQTREGFGKFLKHPFRCLQKNRSIFSSSVYRCHYHFHRWFYLQCESYGIQVLFTSTIVDDFLVFAVLIAIIPLAILDFKEQWRVKNLENALPNFFRDLAGMNDSGMTLPNAVHIVAGAENSDAHPPYQET